MAPVHRSAKVATAEPAYRRQNRVSELLLGEHHTNVVTESSPATAPRDGFQVHTQRLSSNGLRSTDDVRYGEKPVLAPVPTGDGRLYRPPQQLAAWAMREDFNLPFLRPGECFTPQDLLDFQVHKRSPSLRAAIEEIERAVPVLGMKPAFPLSPLAYALHANIVSSEKRSPYPRLPGGSTEGLMNSGAVIDTLTRLFQQLAVNNVVHAEKLTALGASGSRLLEAIREAVPDQRGLQQVLHRSELPMEPLGLDVPLTREEAAACSKETLDQMVAQAPIPKTTPAIQAATELVPKGAFADCHCVAVQHVLATNMTMFDAMQKCGLDPKKTELIGVPYSTNFVVEHAFRQRGYTINTPDVVDPSQVTAAYEAAIGPALQRAIDAALVDGKPILLMDDGGKLTSYVAKHFPQHAHLFRAVEQTTRGLTELASLPEVPIPVVDVAKSPLKMFEMLRIGEQAVAACEELCSQIGMGGITTKPSLVMGYGPIGEGVARALKAAFGEGPWPITVWDPDPEKRAQARADGFFVPETREEAFAGQALVIGCSGHRSLTREDLEMLPHECVVASTSSRDVEVDLSANRDEDVEVVPILTAGRGDRRFATRVWRFGEKDVVMLRNGFPINFDGDYETGTAEDIEMTRAAMVLAAAQALTETTPGVKAADVGQQGRLCEKLSVELPK